MDAEGDVTIDCTATPDLVPNLAVLALSRKNKTRFAGIDALASKESDRIKGIEEIISAAGGRFLYEDGDIVIEGGLAEKDDGEFIYIMTQDHRMVMMAALVSLIAKSPVIIDGWKSVSKSYPSFFKDLKLAEMDEKVGLA